MESQPQNPEFRNNSENFHPCNRSRLILLSAEMFKKPFGLIV